MFRSTIEFKIIERLFIFQHRLSPEFNFAHYVNGLFTVYISELGHVSPTSWMLLAVLVILNYFRAMVIDPTAAGKKQRRRDLLSFSCLDNSDDIMIPFDSPAHHTHNHRKLFDWM